MSGPTGSGEPAPGLPAEGPPSQDPAAAIPIAVLPAASDPHRPKPGTPLRPHRSPSGQHHPSGQARAPPRGPLAEVLAGASTRGWSLVEHTIRQTLLRRTAVVVILLLLLPVTFGAAWVLNPDIADEDREEYVYFQSALLMGELRYPKKISSEGTAQYTLNLASIHSEPLSVRVSEVQNRYGWRPVQVTVPADGTANVSFTATGDQLLREGYDPGLAVDVPSFVNPEFGDRDGFAAGGSRLYFSSFTEVVSVEEVRQELFVTLPSGIYGSLIYLNNVPADQDLNVTVLVFNPIANATEVGISLVPQSGEASNATVVARRAAPAAVYLTLGGFPVDSEVVTLTLRLDDGNDTGEQATLVRRIVPREGIEEQPLVYGYSLKASYVYPNVVHRGQAPPLHVELTSLWAKEQVVSVRTQQGDIINEKPPVVLAPRSNATVIFDLPDPGLAPAIDFVIEVWRLDGDPDTSGVSIERLQMNVYVNIIDGDSSTFFALSIFTLMTSFVYVTLVVVFLALFYAGPAIASDAENKTLQMLVVKPLRRIEVLLYKFAGYMLSVPVLGLVPIVLLYLTVSVGGGKDFGQDHLAVLGGFLVAAFLGLLAYGALFMMISAITRHPILVAGIYVVVWELGSVLLSAGGGSVCGLATASMRGGTISHYVLSLAYRLMEADHPTAAAMTFGPWSTGSGLSIIPAAAEVSVGVLLGVVIVALAIGSTVLRRKDLP